MDMPEETGFGKVIARKCYEIGYALIRISRNASRERFSDHLEDLALKLIRASSERSSKTALETLEAIRQIVRLGADTGVLNNANSELVAREAEQLMRAVNEFGRIDELPVLAREEDLSGVFTEFPDLESFFREKGMRVSYGEHLTSERDDFSSLEILGDLEEGSEVVVEEQPQPEVEKSSGKTMAPAKPPDGGVFHDGAQGAKNRQSVVIDKIRQTEQCKMKDLQEALPGVSERTIRYDIQSLIEKGVIERVGSSGPATFYRIRQ
jgi:hypothetical protein